MSPHVMRLTETLRDFLTERVDLEHVHAAVMTTIPLLERTPPDERVQTALRDADADLEEIGFLRWGSRRHKAAVALVTELYAVLMAPLLHHCPACGLDLDDYPPWGITGLEPSFAICSCCNVEWGYEDGTSESRARFRQLWLDAGASWADRHEPHDGLTTEERLRHAWP